MNGRSFEKVISIVDINSSVIQNIKDDVFLFFKRFFDILISLIGVVFTLPIILIIKLIYICTGDFKPIIFKQKRVGKHGKLINIYKIRSMVPNAEEELNKILKIKKYKKEWDKNQKLENDPRITKIGKILRKTSIDEMPQFINVLIGDMSLIGPRPLVVNELDLHGGIHQLYESVRPGITGWWACNGRSSTDYDERLKLEYYYARNQSLSLDIKCFFRTIKAIFNKTGAK